MPIDLKTLTPDTTIPAGAVLFGADAQSAGTPSVYALSRIVPGVDVRRLGAVGDGTTNDAAAIQAAIDAGGTVLINAPHAIASTLTLKNGSNLEFGPLGQLIFTGTRSGVAVRTDPTTVLHDVRWLGMNIDVGAGFTGKALEIHSAQNVYADVITLQMSGVTSKAITIYADSTGGETAVWKRNVTQCVFGSIVIRGTCGTAMEFGGVDTGYDGNPQVVTLNTFGSVFTEDCRVFGINFIDWTDNNIFPGFVRLVVNANNAIGLQVGGTDGPNNQGVYSNTFGHLAVDAFGVLTGRKAVNLSLSKLTKIVALYSNPVPEGGVVVSDQFAQSYDIDYQVDTSGQFIKYQRGVSHVAETGFNSSAVLTLADNAATSLLIADPSNAGGNVCALIAVASNSANGNGMAWVKVIKSGAPGTPEIVKHSGDVYFETATGALTGTTGTDVRITLSAHNDGRIYIENRIGAAINLRVSVLALSQTA